MIYLGLGWLFLGAAVGVVVTIGERVRWARAIPWITYGVLQYLVLKATGLL